MYRGTRRVPHLRLRPHCVQLYPHWQRTPADRFDTLRRYLEYRGNKVIYVSNITDIDDKLIKKGQEEGTSMKEVRSALRPST